MFVAFGNGTGAQASPDPLVIDVVSLDAAGALQDVSKTAVSAISDTGAVVAYETVDADAVDAADAVASARVWIRDRVEDTSRPVAELGSVAPGISANGCLVAYSVLDVANDSATLVAVDRCVVTADDPLPIGVVLDTIPLPEVATVEHGDEPEVSDAAEPETSVPVEPETSDPVEPSSSDADDAPTELARTWPTVAAPALSFDGSAIVWSTGREVRRYERADPDDPFVRTDAFDVSSTPMPSIVTARSVDISADGETVVFVAGPGSEPFAPAPGNVYAWQSSAGEPELLSSTPAGEPGTADSGSPTISNDATFVVYESSSADLAATAGADVSASFVVGLDRAAGTSQVLVDDATAPAVSADGLHVAYLDHGSIRVLSSDDDSTDDDITDDEGDDELAATETAGSVTISQHGRWLVFASDVDLRTGPVSASSIEAPAVWAVDRASSNPVVVDTTTTTSTTTVPPATSTTAPPASPDDDTTSTIPDVDTSTTASTLPATPVIDRFTVVSGAFPRVVTPRPITPRPAPTPPTIAPTLSATATPATFEPTIVNAGRRTQPVTLFNATPSAIVVGAVTVDPAGAFSVASDGCVGLRLPPAASCAVEVQFAPVDLGPADAVLTFRLDDASVVTAALAGAGVPEPTLESVPAVAGAGQTVTVFGAGFPPASTVELMQPGVELPQPVVVDADGTFAHVVVVLPNTPTGPGLLAVAGQPDSFDDVDAELLVSSRGVGSSGAALRGGLATSTVR